MKISVLWRRFWLKRADGKARVIEAEEHLADAAELRLQLYIIKKRVAALTPHDAVRRKHDVE